MLRRRVASVPGPQGNQCNRGQRRPDERPLPTEGGHEPGNERRRECGAELETHALSALHERPFVRWKPRLEYTGRHWKDRCLGHAERSEERRVGKECRSRW